MTCVPTYKGKTQTSSLIRSNCFTIYEACALDFGVVGNFEFLLYIQFVYHFKGLIV